VVAGSYEFDLGGRVAPFCFILINGKLFLDINVKGKELDEIVPVYGEKMKFEI
jgi:hypothetical protein